MYATTYRVGLHNSPPLAEQARILRVELEGVVYLARQREELALLFRQRHAAALRRDGGRIPVANLRTAASLSTFIVQMCTTRCRWLRTWLCAYLYSSVRRSPLPFHAIVPSATVTLF